MRTHLAFSAALLISGCSNPFAQAEAPTGAAVETANTEQPVTPKVTAPKPVIYYSSVPTNSDYISVIYDSETGCQYLNIRALGYNGGQTIYPRLKANGAPWCGGPSGKDAPTNAP